MYSPHCNFQLFRWAIMQAGTLPRAEFVFNSVFDEELFAEVREKKLATLLATEVIESESQWLNYEFEESQVKIDLGDMILEHIVIETVELLNSLKKRNDPKEEEDEDSSINIVELPINTEEQEEEEFGMVEEAENLEKEGRLVESET